MKEGWYTSRHEAYESPKIGFGAVPDGAPGCSGQVHEPRRGQNPLGSTSGSSNRPSMTNGGTSEFTICACPHLVQLACHCWGIWAVQIVSGPENNEFFRWLQSVNEADRRVRRKLWSSMRHPVQPCLIRT